MSKLDPLFRLLLQQGGTDLHLAAGNPPKARNRGVLEPMPIPALSAADVEDVVQELLTDEAKGEFARFKDVEFSHWVPGLARFRASYFLTAQGPAAVFRVVPEIPVPLEKLVLPPQFEALLERRSGLVLVAAPMGSGRSTLLASIVDRINATSARHVVALEEPIELSHVRKKGVVMQREVGRDTQTFESGVRAALHSDADVIVVGNVPDYATTTAILSAAESGRLVIAMPAIPGAVRTLERLVETAPPERQAEVRAQLADNLLGVLGQILVRRKDLPARVAAHELLLSTPDVSSALREGELREIASVIEAGKALGMRALDDSLASLVAQNVVEPDEARRKATDKSRFA